MAAESRTQGRRIGTEEERGWEEACQGRVRGTGGRWGRDAEKSEEDERLEVQER